MCASERAVSVSQQACVYTAGLHSCMIRPCFTLQLPADDIAKRCRMQRSCMPITHPYPGRSTRYQLLLIRKWLMQRVLPAAGSNMISSCATSCHASSADHESPSQHRSWRQATMPMVHVASVQRSSEAPSSCVSMPACQLWGVSCLQAHSSTA